MTIKFNKLFFASSLMLFSSEICIAAFLTGGFIRHTFGDLLATILMYCAIKSFMEVKPLHLALGVLLFSFLIEFLQLCNLLDFLNLRESKFATIVLGSTFEITDLIAYTFGAITIYIIDVFSKKKNLAFNLKN